MTSRALQRLGDLSYSWYLWHWPVIVFARSLWPSARWVGPIAAVASLGPAAFSYWMVETKYRFPAKASMRSTAALGAACIAIPLAAGFLNAFASSRGSVENFAYLTRQHIDQASGCVSAQPLGDRDPNDCTWNKMGTGPEAVLIGDSNAGHLSEAFIESADSYGYSATIASMSGCPFIQLSVRDIGGSYDECRRFVDASVDYLLATIPDVVFLASSGSYVESEVYQLSADGVHWADSVHDRAMLWEQGQADLSQKLASAGISVVLVHAVPKLPDWDPRQCAAIRWDFGATWCSSSISRTAAIAQSINVRNAEVGASRRGDAHLLDLFDAVCPGVRCTSMRDGILVHSDGVHLTVDTARWLTPVFRDVFSSLGYPADRPEPQEGGSAG
ncbi:MAG: hypothetical protein ACI9N0_002752 [Ilumatobacter sp.]|jgi:hypothetical protein